MQFSKETMKKVAKFISEQPATMSPSLVWMRATNYRRTLELDMTNRKPSSKAKQARFEARARESLVLDV